MDPDATLMRLRALLGGDHSGCEIRGGVIHNETWPSDIYKTTDDLLAMICEAEELFQALDSWILKGGFLPPEWEREERNYRG